MIRYATDHILPSVNKDMSAIDFHNNTEHFTGTFPKLAALCDRDPVVELFEEI
ncbi:MAG: hypothetical protein IKR95_05475 [Oscillospiraceae bacterium]|nr:hypothetical protein [Oscillospiraceae bacterium]